MRTSYEMLPGLEHYYLEDSYVLGVVEEKRTVRFEMLFVLTPEHPLYRAPSPREQHCYRRGQLVFEGCEKIMWKRRDFRPSTDANGVVDYGNIDSLYEDDGWLYLEGDWGELVLKAARPIVILENE